MRTTLRFKITKIRQLGTKMKTPSSTNQCITRFGPKKIGSSLSYGWALIQVGQPKIASRSCQVSRICTRGHAKNREVNGEKRFISLHRETKLCYRTNLIEHEKHTRLRLQINERSVLATAKNERMKNEERKRRRRYGICAKQSMGEIDRRDPSSATLDNDYGQVKRGQATPTS